jgi:hypothetical protein
MAIDGPDLFGDKIVILGRSFQNDNTSTILENPIRLEKERLFKKYPPQLSFFQRRYNNKSLSSNTTC